MPHEFHIGRYLPVLDIPNQASAPTTYGSYIATIDPDSGDLVVNLGGLVVWRSSASTLEHIHMHTPIHPLTRM